MQTHGMLHNRISFPLVLEPLNLTPEQLAIRDLRHAALAESAERLFTTRCQRVTTTVTEGGTYNYVDFLHVERRHGHSNPEIVVARTARSAKLNMAMDVQGEIDTMIYVKSMTSIPIPRVLGYYCKPGVQQYILMEFIEGEPVQGWPSKHSSAFMKRTADDLAKVVFQLSQLRFPEIGSLRIGQHHPLTTDVGPWSCLEPASSGPLVLDRGPWSSSTAWLSSILHHRIAEVNCPDIQPGLLEQWFSQEVFGPDYAGRDCFERGKRLYPLLAPHLPFHSGDQDAELSNAAHNFCLNHGDLNGFNILMQPDGPEAGKIVAVLDWEIASVQPIWAAHMQNFDLWMDESLLKAYVSEIHRLEDEGVGADKALSTSIERGRHCRHFATTLLVEVRDCDLVQKWLDCHEKVACRNCWPIEFLEV